MSHKSVIILVGEEPYLIDRELRQIKDTAKKAGAMDFNFDSYSAKSDELQKILSSCDAMPMMAEFRTVLVRDAQDFKKEGLEVLLNYFENPVKTTRLVLVATKLDGRQKIWKKASDLGYIVTLKVPYDNELPGWVAQEVRAMGLKMTQEALYELIQSVGSSLMTYAALLEQLKTYIFPRTDITLKDVEDLIGYSAQRTVFKFAEMVGQLKHQEAVAALDQLLDEGESPILIIAMITRHFRLLLLAQETAKQSSGEVARILGVPPFFVKTYLDQLRNFAGNTLFEIYQTILEVDRNLKRSSLKQRDILHGFLLKVCKKRHAVM